MNCETHFNQIKEFALDRLKNRLDLFIFRLNMYLRDYTHLTLLNRTSNSCRVVPRWYTDFKEDWLTCTKTMINNNYNTNIHNWTCTCVGYLLSRFLLCKHLISLYYIENNISTDKRIAPHVDNIQYNNIYPYLKITNGEIEKSEMVNYKDISIKFNAKIPDNTNKNSDIDMDYNLFSDDTADTASSSSSSSASVHNFNIQKKEFEDMIKTLQFGITKLESCFATHNEHDANVIRNHLFELRKAPLIQHLISMEKTEKKHKSNPTTRSYSPC